MNGPTSRVPLSLPLVGSPPAGAGDRTEFGFTRTRCGCPSCSVNCHFVPGMLVPSDLDRLARAGGVATGADDPTALLRWAADHLRASPGALVGQQEPDGSLSVTRIPTLVPARAADGARCHWLGGDGRCGVHEASPYGCAFCDSHMPEADGRERSLAALAAIVRDRTGGGPYAALWDELDRRGLTAPGPSESRERMREAVGFDRPFVAPRPASPEPDVAALARAVAAKFAVTGAKRAAPASPAPRAAAGRNDPCPCGSGSKFKRCCGRG